MSKLSFYVAVFLLLLPSAASVAETTEHADPTPAQIDEVFSDWDRTRTPGCVLGVYRDGEIAYARGYGMANLEYGIANSPKTVYRIASTSKQFTAMAIALLDEQGALSLDDDVRKHFPEMPDYGVKITVRDLVHHTSGIRDYTALADLAGLRIFSMEEANAMIFRQENLNFPPGEKYLYSNSNYRLMAQLVERVTGQSFREWTAENIFVPLGMKNTHFNDDHTRIVRNRAYGYAPGPDDEFRVSMTNLDLVGDAALFTTIEDLVLWDANFYDHQLGKKDARLIERIETSAMLKNGEDSRYAFGLQLGEHRGHRAIYHDGGFIGFRTSMSRFPDQRLTVTVLCNLETIDTVSLTLGVADLYLADASEPDAPQETEQTEDTQEEASDDAEQAAEVSVEDLQRMTGEFWSEEQGTLRKLVVRDGKMFYDRGTAGATELTPLSGDRFLMAGLPFRVVVLLEPVDERPEQITVLPEGASPLILRRILQASPTIEELAAYAGDYYSPELKNGYAVEVQDGSLALQINGNSVPLEPLTVDSFFGDGLTLRFVRDQKKRITGYGLDAGRVRNLRFVRQGD